MSNENQTMLNFVNKVIIQNGIKNNLSKEEIQANIGDYKRYLEENDFADPKLLNALSVMEEKAGEYIELAKALNDAGLPLPTIQLEGEEKQIDKSRDEKQVDKSRTEKAPVESVITYNGHKTERFVSADGCASVRGC